jgi:(p)ppGpp synthase/HD superfamily hydrolase
LDQGAAEGRISLSGRKSWRAISASTSSVRRCGEGRIEAIAKELGLKEEEGLLASVRLWQGDARQVLNKFLPPENLDGKKQSLGALARLFRLVAGQKRDLGVKVNGIEDVLVRFPLLQSAARRRGIGFITRGRVTVHVSSCPRVMKRSAEVDVSWEHDGKPHGNQD